jgi:nucleotide-binding universal stress UspA family protein
MAAIRRVVVGVHGSPGSLQALRYATDEARQRDVPLLPVIVWPPPGSNLAGRRQPLPYLRTTWREDAWKQLRTAFEEGLGGIPADLDVELRAECGDIGPMLASIASRPGDLLVIGTGRQAGPRLLRSPVGRYCLANARCPVLAVPPPTLMNEVGHGLRSWRRRMLMPGL